jgi:hypothetical protein
MKKPILMTSVRARFTRLLKGRAGQSTTEYILILAIVVMIASKLKSTLTNTIVTQAGTLDSSMSQIMQSN